MAQPRDKEGGGGVILPEAALRKKKGLSGGVQQLARSEDGPLRGGGEKIDADAGTRRSEAAGRGEQENVRSIQDRPGKIDPGVGCDKV